MDTFYCSACGQVLQLVPELAGSDASCPKCSAVIRVPGEPPPTNFGDQPPVIVTHAARHRQYVDQFTPSQPPVVYVAGNSSAPGIAAVLSFFLIGLGQLFNGQLVYGLLLMITIPLVAVFLGLLFPPLGILFYFVFWVIGIFDAYRTAEAKQRRRYR